MKGTTIIELTDAKGNVERTVDHNYMTNALQYYFKNGGELNPSPFGSGANSDWIYNLLGGVMLFDDTMETEGIEDDPDIIEPPLGVHMVANGVNGVLNSGDPTELGSWNETESGWQADGTYRMVWDWTTSQGNGTIKAVSLCPRFFAYEGIGNASLTQQNTTRISASLYNNARSRSETGAPVALYDDCIWTMDGWSTVRYSPQLDSIDISSLTKLTFHQFSLALSNVEMRGQIQYPDAEIELPAALQNTTMYIRRWQQRGSHLYLLCSGGTAYTDTFYILDVNLSTKTIASTISVVPSTLGSESSDARYMGINEQYFLYHDVCIDYRSMTSVAVSFTTENPASVVSIGDRFYTAHGSINGHLMDCIDPSTGEAFPVNRPSTDMDYESVDYSSLLSWNIGYKEPLLLYIYRNWTLYRNPRFLATINNLDQPVTKTADKTMKVTYTLDFSEEDAT